MTVPKAIVVVGLTERIKVCGVPLHPLAIGVTVIFAVWTEVPLFTLVKLAIFPDPLVASPILVLSLVQL